MNRALPDPRDDDDRQVLRDVAESGCHVVGVLGDETGPAFAYSIGLFHNYDHPEILLFGLAHDLMHRLINNMRDEIQGGARFVPGSSYPEILARFDCHFLPVHRSHFRELLGYARWFYGGDEFQAIQCVWPDMQGHFPWQPECNPKLKHLQPTHDRSA